MDDISWKREKSNKGSETDKGDIRESRLGGRGSGVIKETGERRQHPLRGCAYAPRCPMAEGHCFAGVPALNTGPLHKVACFLADDSEE